MKVVIINKSDSTGGAAVVSYRLMNALVAAGVDARMLVAEKRQHSARVALAASPLALKKAFLAERLRIFIANGFNRATLFKIDTCGDGVNLYNHPWVREADVVCLNWVNQGLLSLRGIRRIAALGKPVVWTMHDMWSMTGVCHHAGRCSGFLHKCGDCPLLGSKASKYDLSSRTWGEKSRLYSAADIHFVAVSNWLSDRAHESELMENADITVIPNAFHFDAERPVSRSNDKIRFLFGAARLDDPIKGLPVLVRATELFADLYPEEASRSELMTFGNVRDPEAISRFGLPHRHLGVLDSAGVRKAYESGDVVLSTSLYETLPGTLVEGQAWGCVPVTLDRGGQSDIVDHLCTGYLAHWPEDEDCEKAARAIAEGMAWAVVELSENGDALRMRMLESARSRFSAEAVADRYLELFARIMR